MPQPRNLFLACVLVATLAGFHAQHAAADEPATPPNIVVILADDLGIGDLGCYNGDSKIPTPHLDSLAADGLRFLDAHSPSSVCTPTRYALLTGRYSWRSRLKSGVLWGASRSLIENDRQTIASMLKTHGYATACIGKWHLGLGESDKKSADWASWAEKPFESGPHTVGFDESYIIPASLDMDPYVYVHNGRVEAAASEKIAGSRRRWDGGGGFWRGGRAAPGFDHEQVLPRFTQKAVEYIESRGEAQKPFFLYLPLPAPHTPWMPLEEFRGKSKAGFYGDFVVQVDQSIGQVLAALEGAGLTENTLVVVSSDNGSHWPADKIKQYGHRANGPYRGMKADIHEGGHRVPTLARWPAGIKAGTTSETLLGLNDLYATFAELVGHEPAEGEAPDSVSFASILAHKTPAEAPQVREDLIHHSIDGTFAIRMGDWKLIEKLGSHGFTQPKNIAPKDGGPRGQLYNLADDPAEKNNVWLEQPERVEDMQGRLDNIRGQ